MKPRRLHIHNFCSIIEDEIEVHDFQPNKSKRY